jgi:hypothetical protein
MRFEKVDSARHTSKEGTNGLELHPSSNIPLNKESTESFSISNCLCSPPLTDLKDNSSRGHSAVLMLRQFWLDYLI